MSRARLKTLSGRANLSMDEASRVVEQLATDGGIVTLPAGSLQLPGRCSTPQPVGVRWQGRADGALSAYHREHPLRRGMQKEELRSRLGLAAQEFPHVVARLAEDGAVADDAGLIRLPGHSCSAQRGADQTSRPIHRHGCVQTPTRRPRETSLTRTCSQC